MKKLIASHISGSRISAGAAFPPFKTCCVKPFGRSALVVRRGIYPKMFTEKGRTV